MRLTQQQILSISQVVSRIAGETAEPYLFGSRLNDLAKGGDVDILIEAEGELDTIAQAKIKMELEQVLGLPVDILIRSRKTKATPFQIIARAQAARLESSP